MKEIETLFASAKQSYDRGDDALEDCGALIKYCLEKLRNDSELREFGKYAGRPPVTYHIFEAGGSSRTRPFRNESFESDPERFSEKFAELIEEIDNGSLQGDHVDQTIYTVIMAFSACYDLWKPGSRKRPGTFFEVFIGSICRRRYLSKGYTLSKHVKIDQAPADADENGLSGQSVSTDLVVFSEALNRGAVIPLKITTRERIVQPYAHQTILDSAYPGVYRSYLTCVSEVQRDDNTNSVKQVCVPGTVALFQKHLSKLSGIYYCDIPQRYGQADFNALVPVKQISSLFSDVEDWLDG